MRVLHRARRRKMRRGQGVRRERLAGRFQMREVLQVVMMEVVREVWVWAAEGRKGGEAWGQ